MLTVAFVIFVLTIAISILITLGYVASDGLDNGNSQARLDRKAKAVVAASPNKTAPEPVQIYSNAARIVLGAFSQVPVEHRPSHDIQAALKALDFKYGIKEVNQHFYYHNDLYCSCTGNCKEYPEYVQMRRAMFDINGALKEQKRVEAKRERAIALAGIENDLKSVDDITAALRQERAIIVDVTKEISV